ncbi:hypothetical protein Tco_0664508 [Tanacetum coccineum]
MVGPIFDDIEKAPTEPNLSITSNDIKIELNEKFLVELRKNMCQGTYNEDVVEHIAKVLKMVDLIYVPCMDSHQLRMKVFPLSLADDAKEWWISEGDGKITTWEELVEKFFCNDLFPFNIIRPDMALPPREQRHIFLRYEELEYTDADIADFKARLARIHRREVHRVNRINYSWDYQIVMSDGLSGTVGSQLILEFFSTIRFWQGLNLIGKPLYFYQFQLGGARRHMSWRQFILALGLHTEEEMQTAGFDFLGTTPSYTLIRDPILRLCHRLIACSIAGRSQAPEKVFEVVYCWEEEKIDGYCPKLPIIDMTELADPATEQAPQQPPPPPPAHSIMSRKFHNLIMKNNMVYKGDNVVGALMNVPIFVGTFSIMTDFAVLEDMDAYRDEGMGDVIFGEPFLREVGIKTRRFDEMITIYNGNDEDLVKEISTNIGGEFSNLEDLEVLES